MALQTFLMKHNRLPCPADPNIDPNLGDENCPSNPSGEILRGVIPSRALGLSGGRLMDAWDCQFTYVVIAEATQDNSFTSRAWPAALELWRHKKAEGEPIRGVAVIISHGANGSDAYLTTNKRPEELPQGEDEKANLDNDHIFVQAEYSTNDDNPFDDQVLFLTEDQIVQPLANQGALITKQAQALEKLKRIENALIGYMAMDGFPPCNEIDESGKPVRKARRGIPKKEELAGKLALSLQDLKDPWGNLIEYSPAEKAVQLIGCEAGVYATPPDPTKEKIFKLRSYGPDGKKDTNSSTDDPDDDIIITRRRTELVGILVAAGIQVDTTNPPPTPPPSTP